MGIYINPRTDTNARQKLATLRSVGSEVPLAEWLAVAEERGAAGRWAVCCVDNGGFIAAGVAYCPAEATAFSWPGDLRHRVFLVLSSEAIVKLDPRTAEWLEEVRSGHVI